MRMKKLSFVALAAAILLGTGSCQKEETLETTTIDQVDQEVVAENLLVELDELTDEGIDLKLSVLKSATVERMYLGDGCAVITFDKESMPQKMVIDFGDGCVGKDEKTRSGKIIITSSAFENLSFERVKTFENFVVDGEKVEGTITKKITFSEEELTRVALIVEDVSVTFEDNTTFTRKGNLTREHSFGIPGVRADDANKTWGEVVTKRANGATITKTIEETTPLLYKVLCRQIVSGIATFSNGDSTWTIDYGNGDCDNTATVTRNGETRTVKLRK
jgi:hypothetical protein